MARYSRSVACRHGIAVGRRRRSAPGVLMEARDGELRRYRGDRRRLVVPGHFVAHTCPACRGPLSGWSRECWCCRHVSNALGRALPWPPVIPMSLYRPGDQLHAMLRGYKDAHASDGRRYFESKLIALVRAYFVRHGDCLLEATGGWQAFCVVPSSTRQGSPRDGLIREGLHRGRPHGEKFRHPLELLLGRSRVLESAEQLPLVAGTGRAGHLAPDPNAFRVGVPGAVQGCRVLLVDDTWTTGARAMSAVAALELGGATVAGVLAVGRMVNPAASAVAGRWWDQLMRSHDVSAPRGSCAAAWATAQPCHASRCVARSAALPVRAAIAGVSDQERGLSVDEGGRGLRATGLGGV